MGPLFPDPIQSNPIHKHLVLNRTRKHRATNHSDGDFYSW